MSQHQLAFLELRPTWTYHRGLPDRTGSSVYTHLIRSKYDPKETMARGRLEYDEEGNVIGGRDPLHWKKTKSVEEFKKGILDLFADGEPRTFNAICIELTGATSDVWLDKPIDQALWALVKDHSLAWANGDGAIFFIDSKFVNWS